MVNHVCGDALTIGPMLPYAQLLYLSRLTIPRLPRFVDDIQGFACYHGHSVFLPFLRRVGVLRLAA